MTTNAMKDTNNNKGKYTYAERKSEKKNKLNSTCLCTLKLNAVTMNKICVELQA